MTNGDLGSGSGRRRSDGGAGVATQTPSARAVRSMHPEVAFARRPARTGNDNLDLILRPGGEQGPSTPERLKVNGAAAGGGNCEGWKRGKGERGTLRNPATRSISLEDARVTILNYRTLSSTPSPIPSLSHSLFFALGLFVSSLRLFSRICEKDLSAIKSFGAIKVNCWYTRVELYIFPEVKSTRGFLTARLDFSFFLYRL